MPDDKDLRECEHNLIEISDCVYDGSENEDIITLWCKKCGAIQQDIESDGRFTRHHKVYKPSLALIKPVKLRRLTDYQLEFRGYNLHISGTIKRHIFENIVKAQLDQIKSDNKGITFEEE